MRRAGLVVDDGCSFMLAARYREADARSGTAPNAMRLAREQIVEAPARRSLCTRPLAVGWPRARGSRGGYAKRMSKCDPSGWRRGGLGGGEVGRGSSPEPIRWWPPGTRPRSPVPGIRVEAFRIVARYDPPVAVVTAPRLAMPSNLRDLYTLVPKPQCIHFTFRRSA